MNTLFFGDNLHILREHIPAESVDLIYLDPPFNSKRAYNVYLIVLDMVFGALHFQNEIVWKRASAHDDPK